MTPLILYQPNLTFSYFKNDECLSPQKHKIISLQTDWHTLANLSLRFFREGGVKEKAESVHWVVH